jgi:hypothetical protein
MQMIDRFSGSLVVFGVSKEDIDACVLLVEFFVSLFYELSEFGQFSFF